MFYNVEATTIGNVKRILDLLYLFAETSLRWVYVHYLVDSYRDEIVLI